MSEGRERGDTKAEMLQQVSFLILHSSPGRSDVVVFFSPFSMLGCHVRSSPQGITDSGTVPSLF